MWQTSGVLERGRGPTWMRLVFPGVFLIYLLQTVSGIEEHASGATEVFGYAVLASFALAYLLALNAKWREPLGAEAPRAFWVALAVMAALCAVESLIAHEDAFVMFVYIAVLTIGALGARAIPFLIALTLTAAFLPAAIPQWHTGLDSDAAFSIPVVSLAMFGFFGVVRANVELTQARTEVARLAAENERNRIARDLHDLLGHSLTTITVKASLAHRLVGRDPDRAAHEMAEVEELARQSLGDVRAAVANYRDLTLTGELATARELLGVAGVEAQLPTSTAHVAPEHQELFGWVVREAVTNVVRHARATRCTVELGRDWIEIRDDGAGSSAPGRGSGLAGLRERAAAAGGTLVGGPMRPVGWRIRVDAPPAHGTSDDRAPTVVVSRT